MCDCFHLAFPNWHAPAPGAGRRLRGPEEDSEIQDSICEEPEILESERPRPQGSSPIEEFPAEKRTEEDPYDSSHKSGSTKKVKKLGFGGRLDKRSPAKMNETESDDSEVIVTAVKETYTKGLIVTGGKKDGIFIKEVKPDSPASKLLSVKEGDQILSATIYFDNVSHEDALQILECAQPYKMEFCLKRNVISTGPKNAETALSEGKDGGSPKMRGQRKMKKQQDRISWPKFPSFGKGHKAQFRRSHSTSEAEEQRKLEISPQTSDAESPFKSPLKSPDGKDKRKKHKGKLKMKTKGHWSKSDEEPHKSEKEQTSEVLVVLGNQDMVVLEENISEELVKKLDVTSKIENEQILPSLSEIEGENKVDLITLGTTNIPVVALSEGEKTECPGKGFRIHEREMSEVEKENQLKFILPEQGTFEPSGFDNIMQQPAKEKPQFDTDSSIQRIGKYSPEENLENKNLEPSFPNISDVEEDKKFLNIGSEKQQKEKNIHENASYGIRTRGPLAGMAASNTHFINTLNGIQFMSPNTSFGVTTETSNLKLKTSDAILANLDKKSESKFRMHNVDLSAFEINEIKMTEKEIIKPHLPKREEIEIPGMEAKELKRNIPGIKVKKIEKIINITKEREIQDSQIKEEFNVKDVKEAVSKFPSFKLPERDITGVLVQREIKIMELRADKSTLTPKVSPSKIMSTNFESKINKGMISPSPTGVKENVMKTVDLPYIDDPTITPAHIDYKKPIKKIQQESDKILRTHDGELMDINFKLPKREDIEIPGMEAIMECNVQNMEDKSAIHQVPKKENVIKSDSEKGKKHKTKKHGDIKAQEKKSNKLKPSTRIAKPDFNVIEQNEDSSKKNDTEIKKIGDTKITTDKQNETSDKGLPEHVEFDTTKSVDVEQKISVLADNFETKHPVQEEGVKEAKADQTSRKGKVFSPTKFKIPSITLPQFGAKASKAATDASSINVQFKDTDICPNEEVKRHTQPPPFCTESHVNKDLPVKSKDTEDTQDTKFKMPKFEISLPEVKTPKITLGLSKKESDINVPEEKTEVSVGQSHELPGAELHDDLHNVDSKSFDVKIKRSGFSFPRIAFSKTETTVPEAEVSIQNVDISLPEGSKHVEEASTKTAILTDDSEQRDSNKYGSPSRFKLPSITFPKFGTKVSKVSEESSEMDLDKGRVEMKDQEMQSESKDSTIKLPKFEISIPEVKGQLKTAEIDISVPMGNVEVHPPDVEEQYGKANVAEKDTKAPEVTMKKIGFSFPRIGFGKSETKSSDADVKTDGSLPEARKEVDGPNTDIKLSKEDTGQKDSIKFGSPTKFKLPSISFPKFGTKASKANVDVSDVSADDKRTEINVLDAEAKLSVKPLTVEIKGPDVDKEAKDIHVEIKEQDIQIKSKENRFNLPKFGISVPEEKGVKTDLSLKKAEIDISVPTGEEVHPVKVKAYLPEVDSKGLNTKIKKPEVTFPLIGFGELEIKAPEADMTLQNADMFLPEASIDKEGPNSNIIFSNEDYEQQDSRFKFPSISVPKIGVKLPKPKVEVSDMDVDIIGTDADAKLTVKPLSVEIKKPDVDNEAKDLSMEIKEQGIPIKNEESTFNLPKFGISLPEVKGPKIDLSLKKAETKISVPDLKVDVHPLDVNKQDVTIKVKADEPEKDSKDIEVKTKRSVFTFPSIGFGKSELKAPEVDVTLPDVDVSRPEASIEIKGPSADINLSKEDSPSKFKLPSISFPKFGTKASKAKVEVSDVSVEIKRPEINVPDAEAKLSVEPLSVKVKGPDVDKESNVDLNVEMQEQNILIKGKGSTFNLPKFGINLPEVKGPKIDLDLKKTETEMSVHEGKVELHPPDINKPDLTVEIEKETEIKTKRSVFTFPSIGFGKSEIKAPEVDMTLPGVDVSLPEASLEMEGPNTDIILSKDNCEQQDETHFGFSTKFNLPSISLPKIGVKPPKAKIEVSDVDIKRPEINVPDTEAKLSVEPLSVEIKGPDIDKEAKDVNVEMKEQDIPIEGTENRFNLPKFGISLPEMKGPKIDLSLNKTEIKMSLPEGKVEVHEPDVNKPNVEGKSDMPEINSNDLDLKTKKSGFTFPSIGFGKSEMKAPEVDVTLQKASIEMEGPSTEMHVSKEDSEQRDSTKFGSPTKFKLPSISFPKFGVKLSKAKAEVSNVDVKRPEINVPDADAKLSVEPLSVELTGPDVDKETKYLNVETKEQNIAIKGKGSTFTLPKFGISLPKVKEPKIDLSLKKTETELSVSEGKVDVHPPDDNKPDVTVEVKADLPEIDSEGLELNTKRSGFNFPSIGFGKSEIKAAEVDVTLPEASIEIEMPSTDIKMSKEDSGQKDSTKFGSPTKFKLPSISLPKFGIKPSKANVEVSDVDVNIKRPEINVPDAEAKLSVEPMSVKIKGPDVDKEAKDFSVKLKEQDIKITGKESTFTLPKLGISLPEVKEPKIDVSMKKAETNISVAEGKIDMHPPDVNKPSATGEVKVDLPDSESLEVNTKRSVFNFPSIGFGKSEIKAAEVDVTLPEASMEIEMPSTDIKLSKEDSGQKDSTKFGSPTKFKLPSISFPKFGTKASKAKVEVSDVDIEIPEINVPDAEAKLSVEPLSVEIKGLDVDKEVKELNVEIKEQDIQIKGKESTFNLPKFGISLPEMKGPKIDLSLNKTEIKMPVPEGKVEVHEPDVNKANVTVEEKSDMPEIDSETLEVKTKRSGFTFPSIGFGKSEMKTPETDVTLPNVDVSLPEASIEIEGLSTDNKLPKEGSGQKDSTKFGSPTKFKLPSISLPKFGTKASKVKVEVSDVEIKRPEINVPDAEVKLSVEPISVEMKASEVDKEAKELNVEIKEQDIQIKDKESAIHLPKFGIHLPEMKGPKIDLSLKKGTEMCVPEGKVDVHAPDVNQPDVTVEVKSDLPEIDSETLEVKTKRSAFTFPSIGFGKSEMKTPETHVTLPNVDVSLPEASIEIEGLSTENKLPKEGSGQKDSTKFGSPTKFKLPSISLPKFGTKASKVKVEVSDVEIKRPEINVPDAEVKLSVEPLSVGIKGPDVDKEAKELNVEIKEQDIQIKDKESTFHLPKFEIRLPDVKGPKIDLSLNKAKTELSVDERKVDVHPPDVNKPDVTVEVKADLPDIDSKGLEVKTKRSVFTFPSIGFGKSEMEPPELDVTLQNVDVSLPEASIEIEMPSTDVNLSKEDSGQKDLTKFGSPTKFKLPSISLPKFGTKVSKPKVDLSDVEVDVKEHEIDVTKPFIEEVNGQDLPIETKDSKFKLPKFAISLPEIKGPKIDFSTKKADLDVSVSKGTVEIHQPSVDVKDGVKEDPPEVFLPEESVKMKEQNTDIKLSKDKAGLKDSKKFGSPTKFKLPSISLPKFGAKVSKLPEEASEVDVDAKQAEKDLSDAAPEADVILPNVDVSLSEGGEQQSENTSKKESGQKDSPTKFKLPSISLPKYGVKVTTTTTEEIYNVNVDPKKPDKRIPDADIKVTSESIKEQDILITGQESFLEVKGPKNNLGFDKVDAKISEELLKAEMLSFDVKVKADLPEVGSKVPEVKVKRSGFSIPKFGFSKSESSEADASHQNVSLPQESLEMEGAMKDEVGQKASGKFDSPTKFKLPSIKLPKFGHQGTKETVDKSSAEGDVKSPEIGLSDSEKLSAEPLHQTIDIKLSNVNIKSGIQSLNERDDVEINNKVTLEQQMHEYQEESPRRDFVKAFDVEFYIPTLDEIEEAKKYTSDTPMQEYDSGISQPSVYDNEVVQLDITTKKREKPTKDQLDHKFEDEPSKNIVFEFASTNKTLLVDEKETFQPPSKAEESPLKDKDAEQSSIRETEVDSPTLSLRSSDAFADVSSAPISEQITSPTKVKVTYSESSASAEVSDIQNEVFTSTTRTKLITIVPNQPEKVNIPFSSETSSSSVDTLKEMSGKIHIIKNYMQTELDTQHAAILTNIDTKNIQTLYSKTVAESVMSVEKTTMRKEHTFVEKHVVKEIFGDDQDSSLVTQKIHIFEGEPIPDDTTSSIQKLKDTMHSDKMRFFESGESSKTIIMSTETKISKHDFSKEDNEEI